MGYLKYMSDTSLIEETRWLLDGIDQARASKSTTLHKNVIDPFGALFESLEASHSLDDWLEVEAARQLQKTLQNRIGQFHERLLGRVPGWTHMGARQVRIDLYNQDKAIIAEVKNKHNTLKGTNVAEAYKTLAEQTKTYSATWGTKVTAYMVFLIPERPTGIDARHSIVRGSGSVRTIDGSAFFDLATGQTDSLAELYWVLPDIISKLRPTVDPAMLRSEFSPLFTAAFGDGGLSRVVRARG